jgi:type IV secretory pathway VirB4 component
LKGQEDIDEEDYNPFNPLCHVLEMRKNRAFLNEFVGMRVGYLGYVGTIETTSEGITRLHNALDQELGIVHETGTIP